MSLASVRPLADRDGAFLNSAAANELQRQFFADGFTLELRVNIFQAGDGMAGDSNENVAYDDARILRRAFGLDLQDNPRGFFGALQRLAQSIRQTHRL